MSHGPGRYHRPLRTPPVWLLVALLPAVLALAGCSTKFAEGQALEAQGRWEEAAEAYRDAVIEDPDDPEFLEALDRANKVVAVDNLERYRKFVAEKAFRKAYARLTAAARQDPSLAAVQEELGKWQRVLVGGRVRFDFSTAQANITTADEVRLIVRINTPNPGETLDAEVDITTGIFFAEDLLYDRPPEWLALYSLNAIGAELVFGRSRIKRFTSREFQRFVSVRSPVLDELSGRLAIPDGGPPTAVRAHRGVQAAQAAASAPHVPAANPHYSLRIDRQRIRVEVADAGAAATFAPLFLYVNGEARRTFVDFGAYEVRLPPETRRWMLRRLPLAEADYFPQFSRNVALQPYFFYRGDVFVFLPARPG